MLKFKYRMYLLFLRYKGLVSLLITSHSFNTSLIIIELFVPNKSKFNDNLDLNHVSPSTMFSIEQI